VVPCIGQRQCVITLQRCGEDPCCSSTLVIILANLLFDLLGDATVKCWQKLFVFVVVFLRLSHILASYGVK